MALEAPAASNALIYDTTSACQHNCHGPSETGILLENSNTANDIHSNPQYDGLGPFHLPWIPSRSSTMKGPNFAGSEPIDREPNLVTQGRKKRRRRPRVCKNKEEAETQRMAHIAVERNRRKQMNEHLAVLRSMMPESYIQRVWTSLFLFLSYAWLQKLRHGYIKAHVCMYICIYVSYSL